MAEIFVNPHLPSYFKFDDSVTSSGSPTSFISDYEDGQVIVFRNLKPQIDFDFWAGLDLNRHPNLKKMKSGIGSRNGTPDPAVEKSLSDTDLDDTTKTKVRTEVDALFTSILPAYRSIFKGYKFTAERAVWRLTTTMNENLHIDTYREPVPQHFARMFINIDTQPRIWQTSWRVDDIIKQQRDNLTPDIVEPLTPNQLWSRLNTSTFGKSSKEWWDNQPRHVAYFNPGDVWIVDSRLVAHQIFYGRRAVSIDFFVDPASMIRPERQYLTMMEILKSEILGQPSNQ